MGEEVSFRTPVNNFGRPDYSWTLYAILCTNCANYIAEPGHTDVPPIPLYERCKCPVDKQLEIIERRRTAKYE